MNGHFKNKNLFKVQNLFTFKNNNNYNLTKLLKKIKKNKKPFQIWILRKSDSNVIVTQRQ